MNKNKRLRKVNARPLPLSNHFNFWNKGISEIGSDVGFRGNIQWIIN